LNGRFYVDWTPGRYVETVEKLKELKGYAAGENVPEELTGWTVNGVLVKVEPTGARLGDRKKGPYFAYRMEYDGLVILISEHQSAQKNMSNVVIRQMVKRVSCWDRRRV